LTNASGDWTGNLANPAAPWLVRLNERSGGRQDPRHHFQTQRRPSLSAAQISAGSASPPASTTFELIPLDTLSRSSAARPPWRHFASTPTTSRLRSGTSWLVYYYDTNLGFGRRTIGPATNSNNVRIRPESACKSSAAAPPHAHLHRRAPHPTFRPSIKTATTTVVHTGSDRTSLSAPWLRKLSFPVWHSSASAADADTVLLFKTAPLGSPISTTAPSGKLLLTPTRMRPRSRPAPSSRSNARHHTRHRRPRPPASLLPMKLKLLLLGVLSALPSRRRKSR